MLRAVKNAGEAWTASFHADLERISNDLNARTARTEEELRAALVAQLDLELAEAKEQGSALREAIEGRVQSLVDTRMAEFEQRRTKDVRELEQRLGLLLDGRSKDLTARVTAELEARAGALDTRRGEQSRETDARYLGALETRSKELEGRVQALLDARAKELEARISNQLSMSRTALDERLTQLSKRLEVDREARFSEISETNSKSLAGLQVRMQSYLDQKMREDTDRERSKYVELLARLKGEVDDALGAGRSTPPASTRPCATASSGRWTTFVGRVRAASPSSRRVSRPNTVSEATGSLRSSSSSSSAPTRSRTSRRRSVRTSRTSTAGCR